MARARFRTIAYSLPRHAHAWSIYKKCNSFNFIIKLMVLSAHFVILYILIFRKMHNILALVGMHCLKIIKPLFMKMQSKMNLKNHQERTKKLFVLLWEFNYWKRETDDLEERSIKNISMKSVITYFCFSIKVLVGDIYAIHKQILKS